MATTEAEALLRRPETRRQLRYMLDGVVPSRSDTRYRERLGSEQVVKEALGLLATRRDRRAARVIADAARAGCDIPPLGNRLRAAKEAKAAAERARYLKRLYKLRLGRKSFSRLLPSLLERVGRQADLAIRQAVSLVGQIGEQAEDDLGRMRTDESFTGKRGRHHKLERTVLHRVEFSRDYKSALVTLREYKSFGSSRWGDSYGSRGGSTYRCYLVVRDATRGTAHLLRVPPKFGNEDTQFFQNFQTPEQRIRAAVAWTFALPAGGYSPTSES